MDESSSNLQSPSLDLANSTTPSLAHSITPGLTNAPPSLSKLYPPSGVKEASLILLKEKNGRFALLREPLYLDKCIVYCDIDMDDYFELQEISTRDTFVFKVSTLYCDRCIVYCDIHMDDYFELQETYTRDTFVFKDFKVSSQYWDKNNL